jgi:hypothetical protein
MTVTVPAKGILAIEIAGLVPQPKFQQRLVSAKAADAWSHDYLEIRTGDARAMILNFGAAATTAYVYLQADDAKFKAVTFTHWAEGKPKQVTDSTYPFELTVPLQADAREFRFQISGAGLDGQAVTSEVATLAK